VGLVQAIALERLAGAHIDGYYYKLRIDRQ
jgi:hypothetical protein